MGAHRLLTGVFALVQENPPAGMVRRFSANRGGMRREMRGSLEPPPRRLAAIVDVASRPSVVALREPIPTGIAGHDADMADTICWKLAKRDILGDLVQDSRLCGTGRVEAKVCLSAARQSENVDLALAPWDWDVDVDSDSARREASWRGWEPGTRETDDRRQQKLGSSKLRRRKIINTEGGGKASGRLGASAPAFGRGESHPFCRSGKCHLRSGPRTSCVCVCVCGASDPGVRGWVWICR